MLQRTSIWVAAPKDAPAVVRLLGEFRDWWGSSGPSDDEMLASVRRIMAGDDGEFLLATSQPHGEPQAVCQIRFRWCVWKSAEDCWLEDLYVQDAARRAGLGRALVEAAVAHAQSRGCRRIDLDVNEDNAPARALYAACGFSFEPKAPGRTLYIARILA